MARDTPVRPRTHDRDEGAPSSASTEAICRRSLLIGGLVAVAGSVGGPAHAAGPSAQFVAAREELAKGREIRTGRIQMDLPRLAENGNSVQLHVTVESPMTPDDHVRAIHVLSDRNPIATVARFHLSPRAGRADVRTYVRLATTQNIHVVAEMSDGSLWGAEAESVVLLAACLDGG